MIRLVEKEQGFLLFRAMYAHLKQIVAVDVAQLTSIE